MVGRARYGREAMTESGHVGVTRAADGKRWEAYVLVMGKDEPVLLGTYPSIRAAVAARAQYWKAKERRGRA